MPSIKTHDYERRVRTLRKRLALDFQPLRDTLSRGLDVLIDPEAAVLCTATIEALCDALFTVTIKTLHEESASSLAPLDTKLTIYHLQVALRTNANFAAILQSIESAAIVLEYFLDDATSKALYERELISIREAKHLRSTVNGAAASSPSEEELIAQHERTRSEWQKREDDPFTEVDFAMVLKCVHPAFTLTHSATMLLSALVRELLNEVCDRANVDSVQRQIPPELYIEDLAPALAQVFHVGSIGQHIERTASECLERFRLRSRQGTTLSIRYRVFTIGANATQSYRASTSNQALHNVARDATFAQLLPLMCKKCHLDANTTVGIYRGHQVDATDSPATLSMPTGAIVYLVAKKWWDHTRRNEARRGQLSSLRPQDAHVKALVEATESKVKNEFIASPSPTGGSTSPFKYFRPAAHPSTLLKRDESLDGKRLTKTLSSKSIHASSATRLITASDVTSPVSRQPGGKDFGGNDEDDIAGDSAEDSLSLLLKQRNALGARQGPSGDNNNQSPKGKTSPTAKSSPVHTHVAHHDMLQTMAAQSTQLMDSLDEAWLGFAGISASVRVIKEKLLMCAENDAEAGGLLEEVENELRGRLDKTSELVRQTTEAHALVAQLLKTAQRLRGASSG